MVSRFNVYFCWKVLGAENCCLFYERAEVVLSMRSAHCWGFFMFKIKLFLIFFKDFGFRCCIIFSFLSALNLSNVPAFPQLLGIEDLHVFNRGSVHVEPTTLMGNGTAPGEIFINSLHVQNKGYFQVKTVDNENDVIMKLNNISVSATYVTHPVDFHFMMFMFLLPIPFLFKMLPFLYT